MAWNRDERYPSAAALRTDLEGYLTATGGNVSAREVGVCVSEMFHQDRAKTNALIDAHIARLRIGAVRGELPVIDVASRSGPGGTPSTPDSPVTPSSVPEVDDALSVEPASVSVAAPSAPHMASPRRRPRPLIVAGVAVAVTFAGIAFVALRSPAEPAPAAPHLEAASLPPAAAPPAPTPAPSASVPQVATVARKPNLVNVEIRVSPATAKLEIDETEVAGNPFAGSYPADTTAHHVRASAPGYVTKSVTVGFYANLTLDLSLEHLPLPAETNPRPAARSIPPGRSLSPPRSAQAPLDNASTPPSSPAPGPPAVTETKPAGTPSEVGLVGGTKPLRAIDPNNPYEAE